MMHQAYTGYGCMHCRPIANCFYTCALSLNGCLYKPQQNATVLIQSHDVKKKLVAYKQLAKDFSSSKCIPYWLLCSANENFKIAHFLIVCIFKYNHML
ncbi:hypothetical protein OIU78_004691 [Salix suchowensis]|nr:hypothetical protein OIU78_004691 [Salix suchowensis]